MGIRLTITTCTRITDERLGTDMKKFRLHFRRRHNCNAIRPFGDLDDVFETVECQSKKLAKAIGVRLAEERTKYGDTWWFKGFD